MGGAARQKKTRSIGKTMEMRNEKKEEDEKKERGCRDEPSNDETSGNQLMV